MAFGEEDGFKNKRRSFTALVKTEHAVLYKIDFQVDDNEQTLFKILPKHQISGLMEPNRKAKLKTWLDRFDELEIAEEMRNKAREVAMNSFQEIQAKKLRTLDFLVKLSERKDKFSEAKSILNTATRGKMEREGGPSELKNFDCKNKEYFEKDTFDLELQNLRKQEKADVLEKCFVKVPSIFAVMKNKIKEQKKIENEYGPVLDDFYRAEEHLLEAKRINLHGRPANSAAEPHNLSFMFDNSSRLMFSQTKPTVQKLFLTSTTHGTNTTTPPTYFRVKHKLAQLVKGSSASRTNAPLRSPNGSKFETTRTMQSKTLMPATLGPKTPRRGLLDKPATVYDRFLKSVS